MALLWGLLLFLNNKSHSQTIEVIKLNALQNLVFNQSDTCYVINFMASWCAPCVKELPEFIKLINNPVYPNIKVLFVSLDLKNTMNESILPLAIKHGLQKVYLINETNANYLINQIDKNWSGAIPATLIIKKAKKKSFKEGTINYNQLIKLVK